MQTNERLSQVTSAYRALEAANSESELKRLQMENESLKSLLTQAFKAK